MWVIMFSWVLQVFGIVWRVKSFAGLRQNTKNVPSKHRFYDSSLVLKSLEIAQDQLSYALLLFRPCQSFTL